MANLLSLSRTGRRADCFDDAWASCHDIEAVLGAHDSGWRGVDDDDYVHAGTLVLSDSGVQSAQCVAVPEPELSQKWGFS